MERTPRQQWGDFFRYMGVSFRELVLHPRTDATIAMNPLTGKIQIFTGVPIEMIEEPKTPTGEYTVAKSKKKSLKTTQKST